MSAPKITVLTMSNLVYEANLHRKVTALALKYDVTLFAVDNGEINEALWKSVNLVRVKISHISTTLKMFHYLIKSLRFLCRHKADLYIAYDVYPLLPLRVKYTFEKMNYIYDSVELFQGINSLIGKRIRKKIWYFYEKFGISGAKAAFTVCDLDAKYLKRLYQLPYHPGIVRNIPIFKGKTDKAHLKNINIPEHFKVGIYQGMLMAGRGLELIVSAVKNIENIVILIVGDGPLMSPLKKKVQKYSIENKIIFCGLVPFNELSAYTALADFGLTVIDGKGMSYYHALPNKLFEYIQAGIPVIGSNYPEIEKIILGEKIGLTVNPNSTPKLEAALRKLIAPEYFPLFKENVNKIKDKYTWEKESERYMDIVDSQLNMDLK
jgi:glycosyltransferase involved in cell wall biosynthesis